MTSLPTFGNVAATNFGSAIVALLVTFCLTQFLAAVYVWTFRGMSYTLGLVHAIVLGGVVACMLMLAIGDSIAAGIGVAGGLALVRFRTALREPRDMMFVFAALGAGIASGLGAIGVAVAGVAVFSLVASTLTFAEYGTKHRIDGLLRFQLAVSTDDRAVASLLSRHTNYVALVTLREVAQGTALEHAYQIRLERPEARRDLLVDLERVPGISGVSLLLQEPTVEL